MQRLNEHLVKHIYPKSKPIITKIEQCDLDLYYINFKTSNNLGHKLLITDGDLKELTSPKDYKDLIERLEFK